MVEGHDPARQRVACSRRPCRRSAGGKEQDHLGGVLDHPTGPRQRGTHVHRLEDGQFFGVLFQQVIDPDQQALPLVRRPAAPLAFESRSCRGDRPVHVSRTAACKACEHGPVCRVVAVELLFRSCSDPLAANKEALGSAQKIRARHSVCVTGSHRISRARVSDAC